jgi:hypothetical protein
MKNLGNKLWIATLILGGTITTLLTIIFILYSIQRVIV